MPIHHFNAGEATHTIKHKRRRFKPYGGVMVIHDAFDGKTAEEVTRLGSGTYSARLFVGLSVGQTPKWIVDDVTAKVYDIRKEQGKSPDASILVQRGLYEDFSGKRVTEESVQVIIIDLSGAEKKAFVEDMKELAEKLRVSLEQEVVILEIQKKGLVTDVFSASA